MKSLTPWRIPKTFDYVLVIAADVVALGLAGAAAARAVPGFLVLVGGTTLAYLGVDGLVFPDRRIHDWSLLLAAVVLIFAVLQIQAR